jgi:NAD(P)-dependent dehydrogenase (short-subunit alcohol dehydrogenase family)
MTWSGATAVVTGGGSGIGKALSLAMAARGARVVVTDVNEEAARSVAAECGPSAVARRLDVRDADAVRAVIEESAAITGKLDYLFNNAGIGVGGEIQDLSLAHWDRILDVNVRGVIHGVVAAYPIMLRQRSGHIVNTASLAGLGAAPLLTPYSMTKHAVVGLSVSLRAEAAALGVRVSALCPAAIETPILDSDNPSDLAPTPWRPDLRRFLTKVAGPPYPVDKLAVEALAAIDRNEGVIVIPGRARLLWRLGRLLPALAESGAKDAVAAERAHKP